VTPPPVLTCAARYARRTSVGAQLLDARLTVHRRRLDRRFAGRDRERLDALRHKEGLRVNVGSGPAKLDGWVNVDLLRDEEGDVIKLDATRPWPLRPGSVAAVNSEHFIEHLPLDAARRYLREAWASLAPGGVIRTSTPDLERLAEVYGARDERLLSEHRRHGYSAGSYAELVNNYFYSHGHRFIYDFDTLARLLAEVGFAEVERAEFGQSAYGLLRGVDRHDGGPLNRLTLAVDAVKPRR
jgi:predicted SAM-dependent methyltransferase